MRAAGARGDPAPRSGAAGRLAPLLARVMLGEEPEDAGELPVRVRAWDGSATGPPGAPEFVIRDRRALRRLLWKPGEMGLVRAYVAGELDIEGDVFAALDAVQRVMRGDDRPIRLSSEDKREIVRTAVTLGAVGPEPRPPAEEFPAGRRAAAGAAPPGPLDAPAAFFARMLGPEMAHACGWWDGAADLDGAQRAALDRAAARLGPLPGARILDVSPGWGALARRLAAGHGARVVALARGAEQARHLADQSSMLVEVREGGLPEVADGPFDAIVGLAGVRPPDHDPALLHDLLAPGGRLLLQWPSRRPGRHRFRRTFTTAYMFPDEGEPDPLGELVGGLEEAGLEVRDVRALREHYARTLRAWAANLERRWDECEELAGPGHVRVWRLFLAASALAYEGGRLGGHEIGAIRRDSHGRAGSAAGEGRATPRSATP